MVTQRHKYRVPSSIYQNPAYLPPFSGAGIFI
jgi:hypothetical protein